MNRERDDRTPALERLTAEAKEKFVAPELDWDRMDDALFAKLDAAELEAQRAEKARTSHTSRWVVAGSALAVAAATMFFLRGSAPEPTQPQAVAVVQGDVSSVLSRLSGELSISGQTAALGANLKAGDTFELRGRRAVFDSPVTAKFMLDGEGTKGRVLREGGSIALSLEAGAVEADVVPGAAAKERFSVEAGRARVSVRGTHLRVARAGRKVTVDLTRGSIAVGREFISAPAHVELDSEDANAIVIDRVNVRPAESFDELASVVPAPQTSAKDSARPSQVPVSPTLPAPRVVASAPVLPTDPKVQLESALRRCMLEHGFPEGSPPIRLSLGTTLQMQVNDEGKVQSARFVPPLPPKAQDCAATAAYATHFQSGGPVSVSVQVEK